MLWLDAKAPPNFWRGFPQKGADRHVIEKCSYVNLLEQKKVLNGKNAHLPQEWFGTPK